MGNLSFKEFQKLTDKKKCERYKDLNSHDKFLARMSHNPGTEVIGYEEVTDEEKEWADKLIKEIEKQEKSK
ncbi:MAG: hypothetical protein ACI4SM_04770 [Candidatus Gastranaerophilaceae bacterium]